LALQYLLSAIYSLFYVLKFALFRYLGDENGLLSVLKYDVDDGKLQKMPYNIPIQSIAGKPFAFLAKMLIRTSVFLPLFPLSANNLLMWAAT
jgi:hypothetical protein